MPNPTDVYDINNNSEDENGACNIINGNTNVQEADDIFQLGWDFIKHAKIDIRLFYSYMHKRDDSAWTECRFPPNDDTLPSFYRISNVSGYPICYTTEALKYAQAAYLVSIVTV